MKKLWLVPFGIIGVYGNLFLVDLLFKNKNSIGWWFEFPTLMILLAFVIASLIMIVGPILLNTVKD